ncbi:MAG: S9 family peptidase, partial [Antricoccus sp.]
MALENSPKSCDQTNSWSDLDAFVATPRLGGLVLSPDGKRLLVSLSSLDGDKTGYQSAWWSIDPDAAEPSRRLTRSVEGESSAAFLPDSSLLFTSKRATPPNHDPEADEDADSVQVLWCLPAGSGEAYVVGRREGGWSGILTATANERITLRVPMHRGTNDEQQDAAKRKLRKKNKISAILHESYPIRFWDHDLGPVADRLACGDLVADGADRMLQSTPLTGDIGRALDDAGWSVSADGTRLVIDWSVPRPGGEIAGTIVSIDTATGDRVTIAEDSADEFAGPVISADGSLVACMRVVESTATAAPDTKLWLITAEGSQLLAPDWDRWPQPIAFSPDNQTLYVVADDQGNGPIFAVDIDSGNVRRLTEDGAYSSVLLSADGSSLYAVRASYTDPGTIVAIDTASGKVRELAGPVSYQALPGRLENVETLAADGATIRGYLLLPDGASAANPAPLALMIHGGPLGSSNCWSWRWCPWLLV